MAAIVLTSANIVVYINNVKFKQVQSISFSIDYGEEEIYGIDCAYAQEIAPKRITVRGKIDTVRLKNSGGLQGANIRPLFTDIAASSYISIRVQDRQSQEDILFIPNAKASNQTHSIGAKSTYKLSFDFVGQIPLEALDRS